tara:strand:- start:21412 stop:22410 length:999 start_codon:yes stop_codon:yes gene_type:complete
MSIIVLDGPDAVGKTTLAKAFSKRYSNVKYLHLKHRWKNNMFDYHTAAFRLAKRWSYEGNIVIIDRWWMSEACYASVYRGGSAWPLQGRFHERLGLTYGVVYVLCLPDETTLDRFEKLKKERHEQYDDIQKVCDMYNKLYYGDESHTDSGNYIDQIIIRGGYYNCPYVMPYTINNWGSKNLMSIFIDLVLQRSNDMLNSQFKGAFVSDNFLGHAKFANYLFVGEQVNPKYRDVFWPFFEYGNCSLYLTKVINDLWVNERDMAYTNIYDKDGNVDLTFPKQFQNDKIIIALGNKAKTELKKAGCQVDYAVKHPSYYKRFCPSELFKQLENMIC